MIASLIKMVSRVCPLCGSANQSAVFAEANFDPSAWGQFAFASRKIPEYMHYRLVLCTTCDLLYASPMPASETLAQAYRSAAYDSKPEAAFAARTYAHLLPPILSRLPALHRALDIGTGDGAFLKELLACGFDEAVGVEPSAAPVAAADEAIRPLIRLGPFRADEFPKGHFSLITCFQTIEHLEKPLRTCRDAVSLLCDGGALLLVFHNRYALSARVLGRKSPIFDIEHLQLFSARSARHLLEAAGLSNVLLKTVINRYPLRYWLRLFPLPGILKNAVIRVAQTSALDRFPVPLPAGNLAAAGYKPPKR
jgi:SAM-dependent methyltransferase